MLSRSVYLHLYQLLPINRTSESMRDLFACAIAPTTVQRAARFSSGKLVHTELKIKAALRDFSIMGVDETGLRVAGLGAGCVAGITSSPIIHPSAHALLFGND